MGTDVSIETIRKRQRLGNASALLKVGVSVLTGEDRFWLTDLHDGRVLIVGYVAAIPEVGGPKYYVVLAPSMKEQGAEVFSSADAGYFEASLPYILAAWWPKLSGDYRAGLRAWDDISNGFGP